MGSASFDRNIELPPVLWLNCHQPPRWDSARRAPLLLHYWDSLCPASLARLPTLRTIQRSYGPWGLVLYGVHRSGFSFAHEPEYVARAARRLGLRWPHAVDEAGAEWPAEPRDGPYGTLLLTPEGACRAQASPTAGGYAQLEAELRRLWRALDPAVDLPPSPPIEAGPSPLDPQSDIPPLRASDAAPRGARQPPILASAGGPGPAFELMGAWQPHADGLLLSEDGGEVRLLRATGPLYAVLGAAAPGLPIAVDVVTRDSQLNPAAFGSDLLRTEHGAALRVDAPRLYHVLKPSAAEPAVLSLRPRRRGLIFYAWMFGRCPELAASNPAV